MYGFGGWIPHCKDCKKPVLGDHADGNGSYYCKAHYRIRMFGYSECPGCIGTGQYMPHGLPARHPQKCPLCKGEGVLDPIDDKRN